MKKNSSSTDSMLTNQDQEKLANITSLLSRLFQKEDEILAALKKKKEKENE